MISPIDAFIAVTISIIFTGLILFIPAIWELTKPKDAGPRKIGEETLPKIQKMANQNLEDAKTNDSKGPILKVT